MPQGFHPWLDVLSKETHCPKGLTTEESLCHSSSAQPPSQDVGESESEDGDEEEDEALVRKSKDADGAKSPLQNEQVLDLTQDEEGDEVPKDAAYEKESADATLADKSLDDTLAEIDAEVAADKAVEMSSQQSSDLQIQPPGGEES